MPIRRCVVTGLNPAAGAWLLAAGAWTLAAGACALQPLAPQGADRGAALQEALDRWAGDSGHYGVEAAVSYPDGEAWDGVAGFAAPGEPLKPDHLISIASITKTMTGAVVLQLAAEGRLQLDDSVGGWLPPHHDVDPAITLRQLLNHTSGVANYTASPALGQAQRDDPSHTFTAEEVIDFIGPARFPPGTRTEYSNTGFVLLGLVAERVTGEPILSLYRERLWEPLRLNEFFFPGHESAPQGPVAHALTADGIVDPLAYPSVLTLAQSAFGLFSTARTVAAWGRALFAGGVLSSEMQSQMRRTVPAAGNIPGETGAGLGIRGYGYLGRTQLGHSGGSWFGSSLLLFDPTTGITVVVLMNQGGGADHFALAPDLLRIAAEPRG